MARRPPRDACNPWRHRVLQWLAAFAVLGALVPAAVQAQTRSTETVLNVARVRAVDAGGGLLEDSDQASTEVDLLAQLTMSPGQSGTVQPGGSVAYLHWITNQGNFTETFDVTASDDLGWVLDLVVPGDTTQSGTGVLVGPVAMGDSALVVLRVTAPPGALLGQIDTATLVARSSRLPQELRTVEDLTRVGDPQFDPLLLRVDPQGPVPPGSVLRYTLEFGNPDPQDPVVLVRMQDVLDPGFEALLQATSGTVADQAVPGRSIEFQQSWDPATRTITWTTPSLPPGFRGELEVQARVSPRAPEGLRIEHTISALGIGVAVVLSNTVSTPVVPPILALSASPLTPEAEPGDPVLYAVAVTNASESNPLTDVEVSFVLPAGFRYLDHGSAANGKPMPGPAGDGRVGRLQVASLEPGAMQRWTLACAVTERANNGTHLAQATVNATVLGDVDLSVSTDAAVRIVGRLELEGTILGRVYIDGDANRAPGEHEGLPNVRVVLEDGTQSMTDARGRFHIEGVRPGLHVLRIDQSELPRDLEFESDGRLAAGSDRTRFVDVHPGEIRKVNFRATRPDDFRRPRFEITMGSESWRFYDFSLFACGETTLLPEAARMLARIAAGASDVVADSLRRHLGEPVARRLAASGIASGSRTAIPGSEDTSPPLPGFASSGASGQPGGPTAGSGTPPGSAGAPRDSVSVRVVRAEGDSVDAGIGPRCRALERVLGVAGRVEDTAPFAPELPLERRVRRMTSDPQILEPADASLARADRIRILVKLPRNMQPRLRVNDREVDDALIGMRLDAPAQHLAAYEYVGVPLEVGDNAIVLEACPDSGECVVRTITVSRSGPPAEVEIHSEPTPADGRTEPIVQVVLLDAAGRPVSHVRFVTVEAEGGVLGDDADPRRDGFQLRLQNGYAKLYLPPAASAGNRRVRVRFGDLREETDVRLLPAPRDWMVTGVGELAVAARPDRQPLTPDQVTDGADVRGGVYAQGRVGESGQLTIGIDSERRRQALFGEQDRERLFPALGDEAAHGSVAASRLPVFARLDVPEGHAQVGDFRTGWTDVELARFDRSLTGFDGSWLAEEGNGRVHGFVASTRQGAAKDEIPGRGISGPYTLSSRPLYVHSERIFIETRDRIHTERVLAARPLVRHVDYAIDYANGTVLLKQPLPGADASFNPMYLVVQYETPEARDEQPIFGLRGTASWRNGLQAGLTAVREETAVRPRTLLGTNGTWAFHPDLTLQYEYARSSGFETDDAIRISFQGRGGPAQRARAYFREIGSDFRNESRTGVAEQGTRKYGVEADVDIGSRGRLAFDGYVQRDLTRGGERYALVTDYAHERGEWIGSVGYRLTGERGEADPRLSNVVAGRARRKLGERVGVEAGVQKAFGEAHSGYPTRLSLGADARLTSGVALKLRQEWDGSSTGRSATLVGLESRLTEHTSVTSRLENVEGMSQDRTSAWVGVRTTVPLGAGWSMNATAEQGRVFTEDTENSAALAVGAECRRPRRLVAMQYEGHSGGTLREHGVHLSSALKFGPAWTFLGRQHWRRTTLAGRPRNSHDLLLAWAYRPVRGDRLQWLASVRSLSNPTPTVYPDLSSSRTVLSLEGSCDLAARYTLVGGFAARLSHASADGAEASARTTLSHMRLIYDLGRFDLSAGIRHRARNDSGDDWSCGAELGYRVLRDVWAVAGYNFAGFVDADLPSQVRSGGAGYVTLRFKFDERLLGLGEPR